MAAAPAATGMVGVLLLALALAGCAAGATAMAKRKLDVQTRMTDTVFLDPVAPAERTVYVDIRNTSDRPDLDIAPQVRDAVAARGYRVVERRAGRPLHPAGQRAAGRAHLAKRLAVGARQRLRRHAARRCCRRCRRLRPGCRRRRRQRHGGRDRRRPRRRRARRPRRRLCPGHQLTPSSPTSRSPSAPRTAGRCASPSRPTSPRAARAR